MKKGEVNDLNTKKAVKGFLSVLLTLIMLSASVLPCFALVSYPDNITREQSLATITKADRLINGFMKSQNTSLKETVLKELYSDKTLSQILTGIYKALESEAGDSLGAVGVNTSVAGLAGRLSRYPSVAEKLSAYSSWSEVDLTGAVWNVTDKSEFSIAVELMFSPFEELLYALLCSGSYTPALLVGIKGSNGYETAIIPTFKAMGCSDYLPAEDFYAQAEKNKGSMIYNIAYDLVSYMEKVLDAPLDNLTAWLPSIANYFVNGGFDSAVAALMSPLRIQVLNIATVIPVESFASFLSDTESFTQNFTLNMNDMLSQTGIPMAPIDLQLIASLGTVNEDGTVTADKADTLIVLLRWLIDTLKMNQSSLSQLLPQADAQTVQLLSGIFSKETDELISFLISLLNQTGAVINDSQWSFPQFTPGQVTYTPNLTAEKYQRVADGVDELLDQFVAEMGEEKSVGAIIKKELYSSRTMSVLFKTLFGAFENEEIAAAAQLLGLDVSPEGIAKAIRSKGFGRAASALSRYEKWSAVSDEGIDLGIKDGNKREFVSVLASALSPFQELLGMLLAEDKIVLFDAVDFYGSNGYNTAVIPIYEALGCEASTIRTHEEFKVLYSKGKGVEALLDPLVSLLDRLTEKPVYTLLEILPNLIYFVESGGFDLCIKNIIYPLTAVLSQLGMENTLDFSVTDKINLNELLTQLLSSADLGIALPTVDVSFFASLGTAVEKQSKRTVNGQNVTVTCIQSDMPALCISLLRIMAETLKNPDNASLIDTLMDSGTDMMGDTELQLPEGTEGIAESFIQSVVDDINAMTVDEATEWLYKLFFRERATVADTSEEDYMPTIIYKPKADYTFVLVILFCLMLIPIGIIVRNKIRLRQLKEDNEENSQEV